MCNLGKEKKSWTLVGKCDHSELSSSQYSIKHAAT